MHLTHHLKALTLLGSLAFSPVHAEKSEQEMNLGYLKCASAVVRTTSFPSCASSYKLDCFCEAQAQEKNAAGLPLTSASRIELEPEVEELCRENGVPKEDITRYLCDDSAVPASPRRGSTPMVRLGAGMQHAAQNERESEDDEEEDDDDDKEDKYDCEDKDKEIMEEAFTEKRSIDPSETRLLIPLNDQSEAPDAKAETDTKTDSNSEVENERIANIDTDDHSSSTAVEKEEEKAGIQILTVTFTKTVCACANTPATELHSEATPAPEGEEASSSASSSTIEPHPMHGTEIAVAILSGTAALPTATSTESSASVRLSSSSVVVSEPVPTGVDGLRGENEGEEGDVFEGGASAVYFTRGSIVGVLGFIGAVVLL